MHYRRDDMVLGFLNVYILFQSFRLQLGGGGIARDD